MKAFVTTIILTCIIMVFFSSCSSHPVMIACVGDSITAGAKHEKQSETAYPRVLDQLLGDGYRVVNCGRSGATALKKSNFSYWNCNEISNVFAIHPDMITIKLGTNDSKPGNWDPEQFKVDYQCLIDTFLSIHPKPKIYLCLPAPVFDHHNFNIRGEVVAHEMIPIIRNLAERNHLPLIDLYQPLMGKAALVPDGVHPGEEGAALLAKVLAQQINE